MRRRGFLTKLAVTTVAAPSIAKAVVEKPEQFVATGKWTKPKPAICKYEVWTAGTRYYKGDVVKGIDGELYRVRDTDRMAEERAAADMFNKAFS